MWDVYEAARGKQSEFFSDLWLLSIKQPPPSHMGRDESSPEGFLELCLDYLCPP